MTLQSTVEVLQTIHNYVNAGYTYMSWSVSMSRSGMEVLCDCGRSSTAREGLLYEARQTRLPTIAEKSIFTMLMYLCPTRSL